MSLPKPYYEQDGITLYHGDCREILPELERAAVLVTDPPYGVSYQSNRGAGHAGIAGDATVELRDEVLSRHRGPFVVFGRWDAPRPAGVSHRLIWSKAPDPGMGDLGFPWGPADEEVYVGGQGFRAKKRLANVLTFKKPHQSSPERAHPTPKPVALMVHLLERCPPGLVLDPFAGSGSTLVAAKDLGRRCIGIELEERYCEVAAQRLAQGVLDFGGPE